MSLHSCFSIQILLKIQKHITWIENHIPSEYVQCKEEICQLFVKHHCHEEGKTNKQFLAAENLLSFVQFDRLTSTFLQNLSDICCKYVRAYKTNMLEKEKVFHQRIIDELYDFDDF